MGIKNSEFRIQNWKLILLFLILNSSFFIFQSCAPKNENPPPPDLIDEKEMASVISDLTLSEVVLSGQPLAEFNDTLRKINVLKEHHLNNERFLSSFKYYTENPKKLKAIYIEVDTLIKQKKLR
ncbi:MAG TPA: DUF4296 domain-containing protein [Bacteroidia bacterium]|jgi:hypothetical protein|nr:DUF4296 domain-containing protein [Bacteroidia bacterium]